VDHREECHGRILHGDGDVVAAGEPLAVMRATIEQAQTKAAIARERAARVEAARAKLAFDRTLSLTNQGFVSVAALDEARAALQSAVANVSAAGAATVVARERARKFTVRSPHPIRADAAQTAWRVNVVRHMGALNEDYTWAYDPAASTPNDSKFWSLTSKSSVLRNSDARIPSIDHSSPRVRRFSIRFRERSVSMAHRIGNYDAIARPNGLGTHRLVSVR